MIQLLVDNSLLCTLRWDLISPPANKVTFPVGHTGLGSTPLWASILHQDSQEAIVWRPEATSVRGWREATIFLGRIPTTFRIRLHSQRSEGRRGDVAVDQLEFLDCALPCKFLKISCPCAEWDHDFLWTQLSISWSIKIAEPWWA